MSMHVMVMGTLVADPVRRMGQTGKPFTTATLRVVCEGAEAFLASLIAFGATPANALAEHVKGDTLVVGGRGMLKSWAGKDGTEQHGLGLVVEQVMSEYQFQRRRRTAESGEGHGTNRETEKAH